MARSISRFGPRASHAPYVRRDLAFDVALGGRGALVPELFAARYAELHLDDAAREVEAQRDDGQSLLGDAALQARDLLFMQQAACADGSARTLEKLPC